MRVVALSLTLCACLGCAPGGFSETTANTSPAGRALPAGFLLGAATSSHQVEGGNENDWTDWERGTFPDGRPHIRHGDRSGRAAGSWELWREDVLALRRLGANAYRISIEWSRLEPTEGAWDAAAAARYREQLVALRAAGITPFVTLWHFTFPRWMAAHGGWEWEGAREAFARFAARAGAEFGDLVDFWITVNEPSGYVGGAYYTGIWPPGIQDPARSVRVLARILHAHGAATTALRRADMVDADGDGHATRVGLSHHMRDIQPASSSALDHVAAGLTDDFTNESIPRAAETGRIRFSIPGVVEIDEYDEEVRGSFDYLGMNYYTRDHIRFDPAGGLRLYYPRERPSNDLGWEVYPEGLYRLLVRFGRRRIPVYVTENGTADANDTHRARFLRAHLYAVERAIAEGADVRGYLHWSLVDNFEWSEGYEGRFGLFGVDFDDPALTRVPRASAGVFREAARALGLTPLDP